MIGFLIWVAYGAITWFVAVEYTKLTWKKYKYKFDCSYCRSKGSKFKTSSNDRKLLDQIKRAHLDGHV